MFEYWGHEASLLPVDLHPLLRWRMGHDHAWSGVVRVAKGRPKLVQQLLEAVRDRGPVTLAELEHLGDAIKRPDPKPGPCGTGARPRRPSRGCSGRGRSRRCATRLPSAVTTCSPGRVVPAEVLAAPTPSDDDAMKALLLLAARSHGVGTARCLADYHRLNIVTSRRLVAELVADGALREVAVEGWQHPAFLHPEAELPRWVRASALLSPFDSLVWERDRTEALFDFRYRIEIYVPAAKRVHGYYVLPFLHDGELVARLDLKADRQAGTLRVRAAYAEPTWDEDKSLPLLAERLEELAKFLGLQGIAVEKKGDLAPNLQRLWSKTSA